MRTRGEFHIWLLCEVEGKEMEQSLCEKNSASTLLTTTHPIILVCVYVCVYETGRKKSLPCLQWLIPEKKYS